MLDATLSYLVRRDILKETLCHDYNDVNSYYSQHQCLNTSLNYHSEEY